MNTQTINPIKLQDVAENVIIANGWLPNVNTNRSGSVVFSRDLPSELLIKSGTVFNMNFNKKRDGEKGLNDPDFNMSILLPVGIAQELRKEMKATADARKAGSDEIL